jgi:hypothetical protein
MVRALVDCEIPVMGHLGLRSQNSCSWRDIRLFEVSCAPP